MPSPESIEKRNFWCHSFEGGVYMGGIAFLSAESVMPSMVASLGGPLWLVALIPSLLIIGFVSPVLFTVPLVRRLLRYKPLVMLTGALQRLPYLFAALALFFFADDHPTWALAIVVAAPLMSGLVGGIGINAWFEMVTRMIPERRRAPGWAVRFIIQGLIGIAAGPLIHRILTTQPGPAGYATLHLIAFGFLALSLLIMVPMKELDPPKPAPPEPGRYWKEVLRVPAQAHRHPVYLRFLFVRFTGVSTMLLAPFMAIHALEISGRSEQDVGYFVTAQMLGGIGGNILAGWLGNRHGGRSAMLLSRCLLIALGITLLFIQSYASFIGAFFLFGFTLFLDRVGDLTLGVELCPRENRPGFLALLTFVHAPAFLLAALLATLLRQHFHDFRYLAAAAIALSSLSLAILYGVPEPRKRPAEPLTPLTSGRR